MSSWRRRTREALLTGVIGAVIGLVGLFAFMTRRPAHPLFERLIDLPVVGLVVADLRRPYLDGEGALDATPAPGRARRAPAEAVASEPEQLEWIGIGSRLYPDRADPSSAILTRSLALYRVRARDGAWLEVELPDGRTAWVDRSAVRDKTPPLGEGTVAPGPLPSRAPTTAQEAAMRAAFSAVPREFMIAQYRALTDLPPARLAELRGTLNSSVQDSALAFEEAYGVRPIGSEARELVVLFAEETSYRKLQASVEGLSLSRSVGHTSGGVVALPVGERPLWEVGGTLRHEVAHLLARRAIGPQLPPWLSEGLATHFAQLEGRDEAELDERFRLREQTVVRYLGPLASLRTLSRSAERGDLPSLEELTSRSEDTFQRSAVAGLLYGHAAYFIEYLLEDAKRAAAFRRFLRGVSEGLDPDAAGLMAVLETDWDLLDRGFAVWLIARAERAQAAGF